MIYILDADAIKNSRITLTLIFLNAFCFLTFNLILPEEYILSFVQINIFVIDNLEIYRLFTAMFLHADFLHLFSNMIALLLFGASVENEFSKLEYMIIYFISGIIGNLFSLLLLPLNVISLGASGAIFGLVGATFIIIALSEERILLFIGLMYIAYFMFSSFLPGINLWAHLFGLLGGIIFGYLFYRKNRGKKDYY